jgi:hypothetical protein
MSKRAPAVAAAILLAVTFTATKRPLPENPAYMVMGTGNLQTAPRIEDVVSIWRVAPELPDPSPPIYVQWRPPPAVVFSIENRAIAPPPPPTVAAPPPQPHSYTVEQWRPLVQTYWPAELVEWALAIMDCESGGDPNADNPISSAAGLFQFLQDTWDRGPAPALGFPSYAEGGVWVPEWNIAGAAWLYANWGGESQWSCKR